MALRRHDARAPVAETVAISRDRNRRVEQQLVATQEIRHPAEMHVDKEYDRGGLGAFEDHLEADSNLHHSLRVAVSTPQAHQSVAEAEKQRRVDRGFDELASCTDAKAPLPLTTPSHTIGHGLVLQHVAAAAVYRVLAASSSERCLCVVPRFDRLDVATLRVAMSVVKDRTGPGRAGLRHPCLNVPQRASSPPAVHGLMNGVVSLACFFFCLINFFSFAECWAFFLFSLGGRWVI